MRTFLLLFVFFLMACGTKSTRTASTLTLVEEKDEDKSQPPEVNGELNADQVGKNKQIGVVKARFNLPYGTVLNEDNTEFETIPVAFLPPNPLFQKNLPIFLGRPVLLDIDEGMMILTTDFSINKPAESFTGKIPGGETAFSIVIDRISGSGVLKPGMRGDILATLPDIGKKGVVCVESDRQPKMDTVAMPLVQNVTLFAVGERFDDLRGNQGYTSITLSVSEKEAAILRAAQTCGKIVFLLQPKEAK